MTHAPLRNFCASTAICAVLALGSIPALAQEIASPLDAPAASVPASPVSAPQQPTIQLPAQVPVTTAQPKVQPPSQNAPAVAIPEEAAPVGSSAERRPTARTGTGQATRSAPAAKSVAAPAPITPEPLPPVASVPLTSPAVTPPPAITAPQEGAKAASDSDWLLGPTAAFAALLAALGLGAGAVFVTRANRRRDGEYEEAYETAPAQFYVEPDPVPGVAYEATGGLEPEWPLPAYTVLDDGPDVRAVEPTPHPTTAQRIGSEELATMSGTAPDTREDRDARLERMVAAEPDAENPFTSRKGRMRRARLILQALEHQQKEAATKPFDWRTYKPSTSNPAPATPPRVTA